MMHLIPCKETAAAEDVAQMFQEHVWKLHGTPKRTVSDRGSTFNSKFVKALYKSLQSTPSFSTAYHLQSDGQTEIKNQWLEAYLLQASIKWAQERYKQADTGKPPPEFQPGDKVWLLALNITSQRPNKKLDHKQYGPFPVIERVGSHAYCLALPETMKIHDVFHVSLLSAFKQDTEFDCTFTPPPPVITAEGEEEYEVDKFVDWAAEDRIWKYRVRWKGYVPHEDTWEPAKDLQHCKDKLRAFFANYLDAPAANNAIPANARKVKRGKMVKQLSKSKTPVLSLHKLSLPKLALLSSSCDPHYPSMPIFSSIDA
ncbi:Chromo (CHRromatin Organization MOdifier) domain [Rhizoctonia solani]|uniref:Chromo (CHRromatin Organization MOdifier) domain n=1 Tax=Rhizoctonia solani TaxID=456999 RepID=A0A8H7I422_9AGAM|nr:Chromo (CHRromatin Organization MOdifier) domain [Rhizoctonia solani]